MKITEKDRVWVQGYELEFLKNSPYTSKEMKEELASFRPQEKDRFNFVYIFKDRRTILWLKNNCAVVNFERYKSKTIEEIEDAIRESGKKVNRELKLYRHLSPSQTTKHNQIFNFIAKEQHKQISLSIMIEFLNGKCFFQLPHGHIFIPNINNAQ